VMDWVKQADRWKGERSVTQQSVAFAALAVYHFWIYVVVTAKLGMPSHVKASLPPTPAPPETPDE